MSDDHYKAGYNGQHPNGMMSTSESYSWHSGRDQKRRDDEEWAKAVFGQPSNNWNPNSSNNSTKSSSSNSKVICTELARQRLFSADDLRRCHDDAKARLSAVHLAGYHQWAIPVVRKMRKSSRLTKVFRVLAQARADEIAARDGETSRSNVLGKVLIALGEPACAFIGRWFVKSAPNYRVLYEKNTLRAR